MLLEQERIQVVEYGKRLLELGLTNGTFGNLSVYSPQQKQMAISPSGVDYLQTQPEQVAVLTLDGLQVDGCSKPSSELDMHRIFYQKRKDVRAVIHTHSLYATTLACLHWEIEPIHYLIASVGGRAPCIPYQQFGTYELAQAAFDAMEYDCNACLLGNHGLLCVGTSLAQALDVVQQMEFLSQLYYQCRLAGGGIALTEEQVSLAVKSYGGYRGHRPENRR